ncbi:TRAP transporter small permease [uncultured Mailhella sp.]|uniref:TRAP transporter small permease subunit n=1 Tax=uncultured Mailhella sp. TaxID=1981031 RepID=UPI0032079ADB
MHEFLKRLSIYSSSLCGWLLAVLMVIICFDIIMRTIGHPILGVAELSMIIMLTTVYFGLANCEQVHGHIVVDFLLERVPPKVAKFLSIVCGVLCFGTLVVCTYAMILNTMDSYAGDEAMAGLVPIEIWPIKALITIGLLLYTIQTLNNLLIIMSIIKPQLDTE